MSSKQAIKINPPAFKAHLLLAAAALLFSSASVVATPKAAEHENAPVTTGIDVAKPKISSKPAKIQITGKKKNQVKKTPHDAEAGKKSRIKK